MSCLENDMIMENIADEIWGKVDNGDEGIWQEITEIGYQKGLHPDDDLEDIVSIMIDNAWENLPDGPIQENV